MVDLTTRITTMKIAIKGVQLTAHDPAKILYDGLVILNINSGFALASF